MNFFFRFFCKNNKVYPTLYVFELDCTKHNNIYLKTREQFNKKIEMQL